MPNRIIISTQAAVNTNLTRLNSTSPPKTDGGTTSCRTTAFKSTIGSVIQLFAAICILMIPIPSSGAPPTPDSDAQGSNGRQSQSGSTAIGTSGYVVPIPEIKMNRIFGDRPKPKEEIRKEPNPEQEDPAPKRRRGPVANPLNTEPKEASQEKAGESLPHPAAPAPRPVGKYEPLILDPPAKEPAPPERPKTGEPLSVPQSPSKVETSPVEPPPAGVETLTVQPNVKKVEPLHAPPKFVEPTRPPQDTEEKTTLKEQPRPALPVDRKPTPPTVTNNEPKEEKEVPEEEYRSPLLRTPPKTPDEILEAPTVKLEILKTKAIAHLPVLLEIEPIKDALKTSSVNKGSGEKSPDSSEWLTLEARRDPEVIPEPVIQTVQEPAPAIPATAAAPKETHREPVKEKIQLSGPEAVGLMPSIREVEPIKDSSKTTSISKSSGDKLSDTSESLTMEARKDPEVIPEPTKKERPTVPEQKTLSESNPIQPPPPSTAAAPATREQSKAEVVPGYVPMEPPGTLAAPAPTPMSPPAEDSKPPLKIASLPPAVTPDAGKETIEDIPKPEEPKTTKKTAPPARELPPSPLDGKVLPTREVRDYLRETVPILEELSLLMTRAPSLVVADFDPSDPNASIFPRDIYLKMDAMKRELQVLDAKTFAIIPPARYSSYHAVIRESITRTYQACDAMISYFNEKNPESLQQVHEHLSKARELIQLTRASTSYTAAH